MTIINAVTLSRERLRDFINCNVLDRLEDGEVRMLFIAMLYAVALDQFNVLETLNLGGEKKIRCWKNFYSQDDRD